MAAGTSAGETTGGPTRGDGGQPPAARSRGEIRYPAAVATLVAIGLYALLPQQVLVLPRLVLPGLELALFAALIAVNPVRMGRQNRISRALALALVLLIALANQVSLVILLSRLVSSGSAQGRQLLLAALQVWATNVIVFALTFWELDRGGPVSRQLVDRDEVPAADFRFAQDENAAAVVEVARGASQHSGWMPTFVDYLYVSLTNSSAFSPTDTMPLTSRAKLLMGTESTAALITSVLVIARAVGSLH